MVWGSLRDHLPHLLDHAEHGWTADLPFVGRHACAIGKARNGGGRLHDRGRYLAVHRRHMLASGVEWSCTLRARLHPVQLNPIPNQLCPSCAPDHPDGSEHRHSRICDRANATASASCCGRAGSCLGRSGIGWICTGVSSFGLSMDQDGTRVTPGPSLARLLFWFQCNQHDGARPAPAQVGCFPTRPARAITIGR